MGREPPPPHLQAVDDPPPDPLREIQAQITAMRQQLQLAIGDHSLGDIKARMLAAGAWPPSPEDLALRPVELLAKYPPPPKTSSSAPGHGNIA